eukprot:scaffold15204_cov73-Phaeocystis_antarctica.AAC.1
MARKHGARRLGADNSLWRAVSREDDDGSVVSHRARMARASCTARSPCCARAVVLRHATTAVHEDIEDVGPPSDGALRWRRVSAQGAPPPPSPPLPSPPPPTPRPELRLSTLASATTSRSCIQLHPPRPRLHGAGLSRPRTLTALPSPPACCRRCSRSVAVRGHRRRASARSSSSMRAMRRAPTSSRPSTRRAGSSSSAGAPARQPRLPP